MMDPLAIPLTSQEARSLNREKLLSILELKIKEGSYLDYKENLSGDNKHEKHKEFLKDVTSFANARGGLILLGVKEPSENLSIEDQIVGISEGDNLSKDLERVAASSIDPRIPGLIINPILISNGLWIIVVHIPPSLIKPHMVNFQKHRCFYIRHSESSVPMTTHEIRETVLSSASSGWIARTYAETEEFEIREYFIGKNPSFLLQANPLIPLEQPWPVLDKQIEDIVRGQNRLMKYSPFDLSSSIRPTPTINGIKGQETRDVNNPWITEVYRNGYIQVAFQIEKREKISKFQSEYFLHEHYSKLFKAFCEFCLELWISTQTDLPYLFRCKYINAKGTIFITDNRRDKFSSPYDRLEITWPDQIRQISDPLERIHLIWTEQLFNAFGLNWKAQK